MYTDFADRSLNHLSILPRNGVCETRTHSSHFCTNTSLAVKRLHQIRPKHRNAVPASRTQKSNENRNAKIGS